MLHTLVRQILGHRYWIIPWRPQPTNVADANGDTFVSFHAERHAGWRNSALPCLGMPACTQWQHYSALLVALGPIWDAALRQSSSKKQSTQAFLDWLRKHLAGLLQVQENEWSSILNIPYTPWLATGKAVFNSLGQPIATVHSAAAKLLSAQEYSKTSPQNREWQAQLLAQAIAVMPDAMRHVHALLYDAPDEQRVDALCLALRDTMAKITPTTAMTAMEAETVDLLAQ